MLLGSDFRIHRSALSDSSCTVDIYVYMYNIYMYANLSNHSDRIKPIALIFKV